MTKELKLLGHIINVKELDVDPNKVKAIEEHLPPTNVKETQIFLGYTGNYRSMIKDCAKIAKPLYDLLKNSVVDFNRVGIFKGLKYGLQPKSYSTRVEKIRLQPESGYNR